MSSKIKIDFDEKALKDLVMKQARNAAQETSFEIPSLASASHILLFLSSLCYTFIAGPLG